MACYYVKLTDGDLGTDVGFLARGERRQTVLCGSYYRAYHYAARCRRNRRLRQLVRETIAAK